MGSARRAELKDHFRIAHEIPVLFSSMRDGHKTVAFSGLPDVYNREGHVPVHGQTDRVIIAEKVIQHGGEVLIRFMVVTP